MGDILFLHETTAPLCTVIHAKKRGKFVASGQTLNTNILSHQTQKNRNTLMNLHVTVLINGEGDGDRTRNLQIDSLVR
jgi:hypothetical protein